MHQPNINHINDLNHIYTIIYYFVNGKIDLAFHRLLNSDTQGTFLNYCLIRSQEFLSLVDNKWAAQPVP